MQNFTLNFCTHNWYHQKIHRIKWGIAGWKAEIQVEKFFKHTLSIIRERILCSTLSWFSFEHSKKESFQEILSIELSFHWNWTVEIFSQCSIMRMNSTTFLSPIRIKSLLQFKRIHFLISSQVPLVCLIIFLFFCCWILCFFYFVFSMNCF